MCISQSTKLVAGTHTGGLVMVSINDKESIAEVNKLVSGDTVTDVGNTRHRRGSETKR